MFVVTILYLLLVVGVILDVKRWFVVSVGKARCKAVHCFNIHRVAEDKDIPAGLLCKGLGGGSELYSGLADICLRKVVDKRATRQYRQRCSGRINIREQIYGKTTRQEGEMAARNQHKSPEGAGVKKR